jgi:CO/xanthine dehydrogenase Mo-binding subunit
MVAEILDMQPEQVSIPTPDTGLAPDSGPSILCRNITAVTRLIETCCTAIQKKRFRSPLPIEVKRSYRGPRNVGWGNESLTGDPFGVVTWCACVVEVEADPVTLATVVRDVWFVVDAGTVSDNQHAQEALELGIIRSLFWAGGSSVSYRKGRIPQSDYQSAVTPDLASAPRITVRFLGGGSRAPLKGIGEAPPASVPAAYIQAVSQATGEYLDRLPSTARTVFSYLEES